MIVGGWYPVFLVFFRAVISDILCPPARYILDAVRTRLHAQVTLKPGTEYPIQSNLWKDRVRAVKANRSSRPKGASADEVGIGMQEQ